MIGTFRFFTGALGATLIAGAALAQALPDGPGKDLTEKTCTACHAATQFSTQRMSQAQWADTVDQMIARGAQVSDDDYPVIVGYLAKNFGTAGAPAAAAPAPSTSAAAKNK